MGIKMQDQGYAEKKQFLLYEYTRNYALKCDSEKPLSSVHYLYAGFFQEFFTTVKRCYTIFFH